MKKMTLNKAIQISNHQDDSDIKTWMEGYNRAVKIHNNNRKKKNFQPSFTESEDLYDAICRIEKLEKQSAEDHDYFERITKRLDELEGLRKRSVIVSNSHSEDMMRLSGRINVLEESCI